MALTGRNLMDVFHVAGWRSPWCTVEYLVLTSLVIAAARHRHHPYGYAFTLAVFAAGAAGYLYEVPLWWSIEGPMGLLRTAANSWSVVDWGMLAVPLFLWTADSAGIRFKRLTFAGLVAYLSYLTLWELYLRVVVRLVVLCMVPSSFFYRFPSFALVLGIVFDLRESRFAWCSRGE